ncbi:MAG: UDP-N-acetylglucosamine 2-epimerase [Nanoarchaeota archaeon]
MIIHIAAITGSRADYGRYMYILQAIASSWKLSVIATAQHLQKAHGETINEVRKDFPDVISVPMTPKDDTLKAMGDAFSQGILDMGNTLAKLKPDILLVLGDRGEMLAGTIAARYQHIPVWHVGGGFLTGSIDDVTRHAITLYSTKHLVANAQCEKVVIAKGANPSDVHIVGAPDIEAIRRKDYTSKETLKSKYHLSGKQLVLVSFHPDTNATDNAAQMKDLMNALEEIDAQYIMTTPNSDAGGESMRKAMRQLKDSQIHENIPYKDYLGLMALAKVIVGNSSAGIIEAPAFGLPAVNIGERQMLRERGTNIIDTQPHAQEIQNAIQKALSDTAFIKRAKEGKSPYGDGHTSDKILQLLKEAIP